MTTFLRKNAWDANNGGQFKDASGNHTQLYWYAKAIQVMQGRPISDPTSWWFYAAIHGQYLLQPITDPRFTYRNWKNIAYIQASAKIGTLPATALTKLYWDQCQHGTWFFPPWHRGYLVALENILRDIISGQLGGPADWALPYWNYMNQSHAYKESGIPPAFTIKLLPDGTSNPLLVPERYGPQGDGKIYVLIGKDVESAANDECQLDKIFSESSQGTPGPGDLFGNFYGGGEIGYYHGGPDIETGDLEMNPHNFVHGMVGGRRVSDQHSGLMGVPATAALDPVFYLHHANIDRLWNAWNATGLNSNPISGDWLTGPRAQSNSRFTMPVDAHGTPWYYTPKDVQDPKNVAYKGGTYAYTYDDLSLTSYIPVPPAPAAGNVALRLMKFGVTGLNEGMMMKNPKRSSELVGAAGNSISLTGSETKVTVTLKSTAWRSVKNSFKNISLTSQPDEVFLQLEGVKGADDANFISVYLNNKFVRSVSLFGLQEASDEDRAHSSSGLNFKFNITNIVDDLHLDNKLDANALDVQIKVKDPLPEGTEITIGRVGLYRLGA